MINNVKRLKWLILCLLFLHSFASAQNYTSECRSFYRIGDYGSAKGSCQLATTINANDLAAWQTSAAIGIALKDETLASQALEKVRTLDPQGTETVLLSAELALLQQDYDGVLNSANAVSSNSLRKLLLLAEAYKGLQQFDMAIGTYQQAIQLAPDRNNLRIALSALLMPRDPKQALAVVRASPKRTPEIYAQEGYILWTLGESERAIRYLESAIKTPKSLSQEQYAQSLMSLSLAYFGIGRFGEGNVVLGQYNSNFGLVGTLLPWILPIFILFIALIILHLIGESRIEPLSSLELEDGPRPWTVASVYRAVMISGFGALLGVLVYGSARFNNLLAIWTPIQDAEAIPVFTALFALILLLMSVQGVRKVGWKSRKVLWIAGEHWQLGVGLGVLWGVASLAYIYFTRALPVPISGYFLPLAQPSYWLFLAFLMPLSEIFFRAYAMPPLEKRYDTWLASGVIVVLYGLCNLLPVPLMLLEGAVLLGLYLYTKSAIPGMLFKLFTYVVLIAASWFLPALHTWLTH